MGHPLKRKTIVVGVAAGILLLGGGAARASIPGSDGTLPAA
jgi:hypothetical protein